MDYWVVRSLFEKLLNVMDREATACRGSEESPDPNAGHRQHGGVSKERNQSSWQKWESVLRVSEARGVSQPEPVVRLLLSRQERG